MKTYGFYRYVLFGCITLLFLHFTLCLLYEDILLGCSIEFQQLFIALSITFFLLSLPFHTLYSFAIKEMHVYAPFNFKKHIRYYIYQLYAWCTYGLICALVYMEGMQLIASRAGSAFLPEITIESGPEMMDLSNVVMMENHSVPFQHSTLLQLCMLAFLAHVFYISSLLTLAKSCHLLSCIDILLNNYMNMCMIIMTSSIYVGNLSPTLVFSSLALYIIAFVNTYGLSGYLAYSDDDIVIEPKRMLSKQKYDECRTPKRIRCGLWKRYRKAVEKATDSVNLIKDGTEKIKANSTFHSCCLSRIVTQSWNFYQPLKGGLFFILFQVFSWTMFGASLLLQVTVFISFYLVEVRLFLNVMANIRVLCILAEIVLVISLFLFEVKPSPKWLVPPQKNAAKAFMLFYCPLFLTSESWKLWAIVPKWTTSMMILLKQQGQTIITTLQSVLRSLILAFFLNLHFFVLSAIYFPYLQTEASVLSALFYGSIVLLYISMVGTFIGQIQRPAHILYQHQLPVKLLLFTILPILWSVHCYRLNIPSRYTILITALLWNIYGFVTFRGSPAFDCSRKSSLFVAIMTRIAEALEQHYSLTIIKETDGNSFSSDDMLLSAQKLAELPSATAWEVSPPYMFAYHPHGIVPLTTAWLQFTKAWKSLFPTTGMSYSLLSASITHNVPLLRDLLQFLGGCEVTRHAIECRIKEKEPILLVPGGQAEIILSRSKSKRVHLCNSHAGFLRLAYRTRTPVVPILCYQENELLDNMQFPSLQKWAIKRFTFPFPFFPYGVAYLPIPRKTEMTIVLGEPFDIYAYGKQLRDTHKILSEKEMIIEIQKAYYNKVLEIFERNKVQAGCEDYEMIFSS